MATELKKSDLEAMIDERAGGKLKEMQEQLEGWREEAAKIQEENKRLNAEMDKVQRTWTREIESGGTGSDAKHVIAADPLKGKGLGLARCARYVGLAHLERANPVDIAKRFKDDAAVESFEKALTAGEFAEGGAAVPEPLAGEFIDALTSRAVVRGSGVQVMPMPHGGMRIPRITTDASASYKGEQVGGDRSGLKTGDLTFQARYLRVKEAVSNSLLRRSTPAGDMWIRDRLVRSAARREDQALLRGSGDNGVPKGMRFQAKAGNVFDRESSPDLVKITNDLIKAISNLADADVPMDRPAWYLRPITKWNIYKRRDSNGNLAFAEMMNAGNLFGIPFFETSNIPNNVGDGSNKTEVYLAETSMCVIGDTLALQVGVSTEAAYDDGGTLRSAFDEDATVIRVLAEHDFQVEHPEAISVITDIDW